MPRGSRPNSLAWLQTCSNRLAAVVRRDPLLLPWQNDIPIGADMSTLRLILEDMTQQAGIERCLPTVGAGFALMAFRRRSVRRHRVAAEP